VFGSDAAEVIDDPDDLAALVRAISRFSDSMEQRQNAGIAARKIALEHTWREMARDYLELFQISRYSDPAPRIKESRLLL
jgi:glycosyltransferase involved in cell wall biosynthesis